jgi:hypothetical protein
VTLTEVDKERFAVEQLGHQVCGAIMRADIVNREDVGMGQRGDRARFAFEPGTSIGCVIR